MAGNDRINPSYYKRGGLEVIDIIEAFTSDLRGVEAVDTGNAIKYITRWSQKNGIQDLKKAKWYIDHLINHLEKTYSGSEAIETRDKEGELVCISKETM